MLSWLTDRFRKYLSSDRDYRIDYINKNINKISSDILLSIEINAFLNKEHRVLNFYNLLDTFEQFYKTLDEEYDSTMPIEYGCTISKNKVVTIQSMLYRDGYLSKDYRELLLKVINRYNRSLKLVNDMKENREITVSMDYNCNLFRLYIINMEQIIDRLFNALSNY